MKGKWISLILGFFMLLAFCVGCEKGNDPDGEQAGGVPITVTQDNFEKEVLQSQKVVLLDFWASWCGPCRLLAPVLEEIAAERTDIVVGKINVDEEAELMRRYGVTSLPTLIVIKDGRVENRDVGYRSKDRVLLLLEGIA